MAIAISATFAVALVLAGGLLAVDVRGLAARTADYGKRMRAIYGLLSPGYTTRYRVRQMGVAMILVGLLLLALLSVAVLTS